MEVVVSLPPNDLFPVLVEETTRIYNLKVLIKAKLPNQLASIDEPSLTVYKGIWRNDEIEPDGEALRSRALLGPIIAQFKTDRPNDEPCFFVTAPSAPTQRNLLRFQRRLFSGPAVTENGVVPGSPVNLLRDSLVERIVGLTKPGHFSLILIKAPPASGKTTLLQFLASHYEKCGVQPIEIRFDPGEDPHEQLPFNALGEVDVPSGSVILADECQYAYSNAKFWLRISKGRSAHFHFIGVATYHFGNMPDSPIIDTLLKFDDIKLSEVEASQYYQNYLQAFDFVNPRFQDLKGLVLSQCNGHPGLIKESLSQLQGIVKANRDVTEADCMKLVLSNDFVTGYRRIWASTLILEPQDRVALSKWLLDRASNLRTDSPEALLHKLTRAFVIIDESDPVFWCPLVERRVLRQIFPSRATEPFEGTILDLVVEVVKTLPSLELQNACGARKFPMEAAFQHLFLVGLASVLPPDQEIVPEKAITNTGLRVDFFINGSKNWALELLVQSDRLGTHADRFVSGPYARVTTKELSFDVCLR
eukprot:c20741_g1_i14.p1 GENE.c20741_g1_i14~~c20741_g1_i14.p1  ORF type:complete len:532 (+),score=92.91 c20741_g1_i14:38-1633(+)